MNETPEHRTSLPIHPACGYRLGSLGCRQFHRKAGEPVPEEPTLQQAMAANIDQGYVKFSEVRDTADGPRVRYELTDKGRRRAEELLGLPTGTLDEG